MPALMPLATAVHRAVYVAARQLATSALLWRLPTPRPRPPQAGSCIETAPERIQAGARLSLLAPPAQLIELQQGLDGSKGVNVQRSQLLYDGMRLGLEERELQSLPPCLDSGPSAHDVGACTRAAALKGLQYLAGTLVTGDNACDH